MKNFKHNLKLLRKKFKLTQNELSKKLNISRQTLSYFETGARDPDITTLINIAKFFDCSIDFLIFGETNSKSSDLENILNSALFSKNELLVSLKNKEIELKDTLKKLNTFINLLEQNNDIEYSEELSITTKNNLTELEYLNSIDTDFYNNNNIIIFDAPKYKHLSKNEIDDIPILADISAGYPVYTNNDKKEFCFHIKSDDLAHDSDNYFALKIKGDSMNELYKDGDYILVEKTSCVENGTPAIVVIENDYATCKIFSKDELCVCLEPRSTNPKHKKQTYPLSKYNYRILGKVLGVINEYE